MKQVLGPHLDSEKFVFPTVCNIVVVSSLEQEIGLRKAYVSSISDDSLTVDYEPESFPGLILKQGKGTANIFSSGKMIILGLCSAEEIAVFDNRVKTLLEQQDLG